MQEEQKRLASFRYSICVSGAAAGATVGEGADKAAKLGESVARAGHILTTGATVGLPYYAAYGAKQAHGMSIGFSPATSLREHIRKYRLPHDVFDFINFTGRDYAGRDLYLVQSSDAIVTIGGRIGSLQEFASALEAHKPCGVLLGSGGTADLIPKLIELLHPLPSGHAIIFERDPAVLIHKIIEVLDEKYADIREQMKHDEYWFMRQSSIRKASTHEG
ncbi:MAG TPA: hypothetical protein VGS08_04800 [Candidatus Saccharimonadales bacterium]|nr:hypothetical protein [Candidatus Saccharimonadales bacterium]